ncbi:unnamed protein product [Protopolystoma xenopodis]|uniref:Uncharacterized protein n=1 Tax=Protopolystoma xenopodis TaxID=117903 RepID=A0A3S5BX49_9PLAT|nr:unnamed protein product [Protopolystoma xenopodis]
MPSTVQPLASVAVAGGSTVTSVPGVLSDRDKLDLDGLLWDIQRTLFEYLTISIVRPSSRNFIVHAKVGVLIIQ